MSEPLTKVKEFVFNDRPALFDIDGNEINIEEDKGKVPYRMSLCLFTEDKGTDIASYSKYFQVYDKKYYCALCNNEKKSKDGVTSNVYSTQENRSDLKSGCAIGASDGNQILRSHQSTILLRVWFFIFLGASQRSTPCIEFNC